MNRRGEGWWSKRITTSTRSGRGTCGPDLINPYSPLGRFGCLFGGVLGLYEAISESVPTGTFQVGAGFSGARFGVMSSRARVVTLSQVTEGI